MKLLLGLGLLLMISWATGSPTRDRRDACSNATCEREEELQSWMGVLFNGITALPKKDKPVSILTFGSNAYPILLGSTDMDAIMAAASLGNGKVLAIGRSDYVKKLGGKEKKETLAQLHTNIKSWITNGDSVDDGIVCEPTDSASLTTCLTDASKRLLLWTSGDWPSAADNQAVTDWVAAGNGLVHAFNRNLWLNSNKESVMKIGFYSTLLAAGIAYDNNNAKCPNSMPVKTDPSTVSLLVSLNMIEVAQKLTFENIVDNAQVKNIQTRVKNSQQFFPLGVASRILAPFEQFAIAMEEQMYWPEGSEEDRTTLVFAGPQQHAMYKLYYALAVAHLWKPKAPNVELFPGDITEPVATETASFSFSSVPHKEYFSTGYYLLPGQEMTITIGNEEGDDTYTEFILLIGCHTDGLEKQDMLKRWPVIMREVMFTARQMTVRWMFGGLLSVKSPSKGTGRQIVMTISGVIPAPYLNLDDPASIAEWPTRRHAPGLCADMRGKFSRFTIQSSGVRELDTPWLRMEEWDDMITKGYDLIGKPENMRRVQWMTVDLQTSGGIMHSGYPLVGCLSKGDPTERGYVFSGTYDGQWGMFHEVGHNLASKAWTWPGVGEVTCNIFAMLHMERMAGQTQWPQVKVEAIMGAKALRKWLRDDTANALTLSKAGLLSYSQLVRDFGWGCMQGVFHSYNVDEAAGVDFVTKSIFDRQQEWVIRYSEQVGYNLCPLFDFWRWDLADETRQRLQNLPAYFPDDAITQMEEAQLQTSEVLAAYPNLHRTADVTPNCPTFAL